MSDSVLKIGFPAPYFSLPDYQNEDVNLTQFRDQWIVLYFYALDDSPSCTLEAQDFSRLIDDFGRLNTVVIGISPDNAEKHKRFIANHNLRITLLSDPAHQTMAAYGVWRLKKLYGREYEGLIRTTCLIDPTGVVAAIWDGVRVKGHAEKVKAKLMELQKACVT